MKVNAFDDIIAIDQAWSSKVETSRVSRRIEDLPPVGAHQEPVTYIREPELPEGTVVGLTGDSGSRKSTVATAWARDAIGTGRPVLILDRENPRSVAFDRMNRLGLEDGPLLRWAGGWTGEDAPLPDAEMVVNWITACGGLKPLVIVDSLVAFLGGDENSAGDMRTFLHRSRRLADLGATAVVLHHDGKSESARDFRGSSDFKAAVDQAFHVTNVSSDMRLDRVRLRSFKSRYGFCGEIVYRYADGRFIRDERVQSPALTAADQLAAILRQNPCITGPALEAKAFEIGIGRNRVRDFLTAGVLAGSIEKKQGSQNAKKYALKGDQN